MKSDNRKSLIVLAMMLGSIALIALSLPRNAGQINTMLTYEVGRPWRNPTLISPFNIPYEYDEATKKRITDSVMDAFVHYYKYDMDLASARMSAFGRALSAQPGLSAATRGKATALLGQLYSDGIVDSHTSAEIMSGRMRHVFKFENDGTSTKPVASKLATEGLHSAAQVYQIVDSAFAGTPGHDVLMQSLTDYIEPNFIKDERDDKQLEEAVNNALVAPVEDLVQQGEAIIRPGDIVSPRSDAVIQAYRRILEQNSAKLAGTDRYTLLGQIGIVALLLSVFYAFFRLMRPRVFSNLRRMTFLITLLTLMVVVVLWLVQFRPNYMYLVPFAIVPIIITTFFDTRASFFVHLIVILICSLVAHEQASFIIMQFLAGAIAVASMQELSRRSQLVRCALLIFLAYCLSFTALELVRGIDIDKIDWYYFVYFAVNCVVLSFAYVVIFLVEKIFGFTSTVTLVELSDITTPVLRRLADNCPGTFQHALQVANIASEAALKVGASSQLVRAGALYHDIGKIENPAFFTENQSGVNPHDALAPEQSARIVIQHVTDGVKMADKARLPQVIKDIIAQHHGRGMTKFFYAQACKASPDGTADASLFTYPGPNPQTREAAIVMMADSCEAAAKSLSDHGEEALKALVERIIDSQVADGLLREAPISFSDVETVKRVFVERLKSFYHTRISYPEDIKPGKDDKSGE